MTKNNINLLQHSGTVIYLGQVFSIEESVHYFHLLLDTIDWKHDELIIFGKKITTKRKVAWYADKPYDYVYSNTAKRALPWTKELLEIKKRVEDITKETYNSCLLNLYHDGMEGMSWHSDDEPEMKYDGAIVSVSFGAERKFAFKHKSTKEKVELILENGSVLLMKNETQRYWLHRLPPTKKILLPRISLTFRTFMEQ